MRTGILALGLSFCLAAPVFGADVKVDPNLYLDEVKYLASPELKGRASGSPELEIAAKYIANKYREFGLKPANGKSFLQAFQIVASARLGPQNHLTLTQNGQPADLRAAVDYVPLSLSSEGKFNGGVVFAGYGITAPEYHYDDYAGLDAKGKVVLVLRHEPQENDEHSVFAGKNYTVFAEFASKAANAKAHGAVGLIVMEDRANHPKQPWELAKVAADEDSKDAGIPVVEVKEQFVDGWFQNAGKDPEKIVAAIDKELKPESFPFSDTIRVTGQVNVIHIHKTVHNVAAYLPGSTPEYVIIGAHYDHLGMGGRYSMARGITAVHPGADDNASGTAGVIELARWYSKQPQQKRGILFLNFAGEELGLLGSAWYVAHPELPLDKAVAMINMDMIGRIRESKLYVGGVSTGSGLRQLVEQADAKYPFKVDFSEGPESNASDHTSFVNGSVPSLFFFSGLHSDYHRPSDTADKIDAPDAAKMLAMVSEITDTLREEPGRPQFERPAPSPHGTAGGAGPISGSGAGGYGPWFGSIPDFGEGIKGVKFGGISPGSPAEKAGLKAGDVMTEFDGKKIDNLYDFTLALRAKQPGDKVLVKVTRDGKELEVTVELARRP